RRAQSDWLRADRRSGTPGSSNTDLRNGVIELNPEMSAIGTKRTSHFAPHMSAFGGKADMRSGFGWYWKNVLGIYASARFRLRRQLSRPNTPRPALNKGRATGSGVGAPAWKVPRRGIQLNG